VEAQHEPSPTEPGDLADARRRVDAIDAQLVKLISARGQLAQRIGRLKTADGTPIYAPDRESEILQRLCRDNPGPFPNSVLLAVYREIMSGSFALERALRIAFLGPRGSFSHLAATGKFGQAVEYEPVGDIPAAFAEVERGHADFAVVPVENSLGGGVHDTLDAFVTSPVKVCAEIIRRVHHNLLTRLPLAQVERVYSKPEVFDQCKHWLMETGLLARTIATASTSKAAEQAAAEDGAAAIGSTLAAELHNLPIQVPNIEDNPNNVTRFFVLGREPARRTGDDKTAILFTTAHRAGALADVLNAFRAEQVNLSMIVSLPSRRNAWEYYFFVDAEGHADDPPLIRALAAAREFCLYLTVLGSFPRATEIA
jgi:chorismate mutase/prephenate dehydratase